MFTGIVTDIGEVIAVEVVARDLHRLKIGCRYERGSIAMGASIACSGICLTVVDLGEQNGRAWFAVDAAAETLAVTTAGRWQPGSRLNLERALRLGDELGGHMVTGHIDGIADVVRREDLPDMARIDLRVSSDLARFVASKGSVALDGVSLTVNAVEDEAFSVLIIPHTLRATTFGMLHAGDAVNLEVDLIARYVARLVDRP